MNEDQKVKAKIIVQCYQNGRNATNELLFFIENGEFESWPN